MADDCIRCVKNPVPDGRATCDPCMDEIYAAKPHLDPRRMTNKTTSAIDLVERVARAMEPEAWEALDGKRRDLIKYQVARTNSLRKARAAIAAYESEAADTITRSSVGGE